MTSFKVTIEIHPATSEVCGSCKWFIRMPLDHCALFRATIFGGGRRCRACMRAEVEAKNGEAREEKER